MPIYNNGKKPREKGYSFKDGKFNLGSTQEGPQEKPKTAIEQAGLIPEKQQKDSEKGWQLEKEDGSKEDVGVPYTDKPKEDTKFAPNPGKDPKAAQQFLKDKGVDIGVDGKWGPKSQKALDKYNKENGTRNVDVLRGTLKDLGIEEKSYAGKRKGFSEGELSSGGDLHPGTVALAKDFLPGIKDAVGDNLRVTGGNDAYHVSEKYLKKRGGKKSAHGEGRALDIAVIPAGKPKSKWDEADVKAIGDTWESFKDKAGDDLKEGKLRSGVPYIQGDGWRVLNEYERGSGASTGGHFHISIFKNGKWVNADPHH